MSIIVIYSEDPSFPATDQHPDAVRYKVGAYWVDAIGGEPTQEDVDAIINPPAPTPTLTKRQINAALITGAGLLDPDPSIELAIGAIVDPTAKALALNDWRTVKEYQRGHALFNDPDLLAAMGMSPVQVDGLWALATTLPA